MEITEKKILIVDDEEDVRDMLHFSLSSMGYDVLDAEDGMKALQIFRDAHPQIVLTDIKMPSMDGIELLKRLRESEQHAKTPILMLTSLGREEDIVRAFNLGASDYLTKPFSPVELLARVQRLLRRSGFHRMPSTP